jgi:hypothetical protein
MLQILLVKGEIFDDAKSVLIMSVGSLIDSCILNLAAYFIFILIKADLIFIKLLMILFYLETTKNFQLLVWVHFKLGCMMTLLGQ